MSRFICLIGLLIVLISFEAYAAPSSDYDGAFRFVVLGDTRSKSGHNTEEPSDVFLQNIDSINTLAPDFVVNVGDLVWGYTGKNRLIRQWDAYDKSIKLLEPEYYQVVGNHDVFSNESADVYRERYGPLYYSFNYGRSHFIVLNTEEPGAMGKISDEQLRWLSADLDSNAGAGQTFVFLHKPLWRPDSRLREWSADAWMSRVHPLLRKQRVAAVFGSHWHKFTTETIDGIRYTITGGGGAEISGPAEEGNFHHYVLVTALPDEISYTLVKTDGTTPTDFGATRDVDIIADIPLARIDHVDAFPGRPIEAGAVVHLSNPTQKALNYSLKWSVPYGWRVDANIHEKRLEPSEKADLPIRIYGPGLTTPTFIVPTLTVQADYPMFSGRVHLIRERYSVPVMWR